MSDPIVSPLETRGPRALMDRKIIVQSGETSTFRLMHDPKDTDQRWFVQGERSVRRGNEVTYLIRGEETYAAMAAAIKLTSTPPLDIIYLIGWGCDIDLPLIIGDPGSTLRKLLTEASSRGVEIRVMLWANMKGPGALGDALTVFQVKFINTLPTGRAILDTKTVVLTTIPLPNFPGVLGGGVINWPVHRGSHHQKLLVTHGKSGLIAFCGGVDVSADRIVPGLHDVHCQIRGPAAHDLLVLFSDRWRDYLDNPSPELVDHDLFPPRKVPTFLLPEGEVDHSRDFLSAGRIPAPGQAFGDQLVQTGRTTPKKVHTGFRPQGEQSARKMILKGIASAKSFIYMEDQYLLNLECADALAQAAAKPSMKHITIVLPGDEGIDGEFLGLASFHRAEFVKRLQASDGAKKIQLFCSDRYTHSKTYIFDDKYAITGSANCNRRGWEHDSEVVVGIFDESKDDAPALHFAKRLRMKLWADHFNLAGETEPQPLRPSSTQEEFAELADGVASAAHWRKRPPGARMRPYAPIDHHGKTAQQVLEETMHGQLASILTGLNPTAKARALQLIAVLEAFLKSQGLVESRVWDEVLDPPSPL